MKDVQRTAFGEAGFTEAQTNVLVMALEPLATKEDLRSIAAELRSDLGDLRSDYRGLRSDVEGLRSDVEGLRSDVEGLRSDYRGLRSDVAMIGNDVRWMKWVGGAIGVAVLTEMVSGFFT